MYDNWDDLVMACTNCQKCALSETRTNVVVGTGNPKADILFVGEGPGEYEDLQAEPFVGRSGKLLDMMLAEIGLDRKKNIYIANTVKCRPPKNRDPQQSEQDACIEWLRNQFALIRPKIIVCLGRISSAKLIKPDIKIMKEHGKFFRKGDTVMMGILHPAALLRNPNNMPLAKEDFERLKRKAIELKCKI